uniref:Uncharacterized protein n=1 Tax=Panagrolaimus sp. JU765 TaxID=591449 RepID=A0AC34RRL1_9BILA
MENTHPMQISDYDNLNSETMLQYPTDESSSDDKPSISQTKTSPKKLEFSTIIGMPRNNNFIHHSNQMSRSFSDNFPTQTTSNASIAKYNVIKSTTVTEQLSNYQSQLPPSAFIVALQKNMQILAIKRPTDLSLKTEKCPKSTQCFTDNGTPIDCTVQSGVLLNSKGKINETYL